MAVYKIFDYYDRAYSEALEQLDSLIREKEALFAKTQPKSTRYDKERLLGGDKSNAFDEYVIAKEQTKIDERIEEAKKLAGYRKDLRDHKLAVLRMSKFPRDMLYYYIYVENKGIDEAAKLINYSKAQTYRMLKIIKTDTKRDLNETS